MNLIINDKEVEKIVLAHLLKVRKIEEQAYKLVQSQLKGLVARVLLKVNQNLKYKEPSRYYESLYYMYKEINDFYMAYSKYGNKEISILENIPIREAFYYNKSQIDTKLLDMVIGEYNPITYERVLMISVGIAKVKSLLDSALEERESRCAIDNHLTTSQLTNLMKEQMTLFFVEQLPAITKLLKTSVALLGIPEEADNYKKFIYDQKEFIKLIVMKSEALEIDLETEAESQVALTLTGILKNMYDSIVNHEKNLKKNLSLPFSVSELLNKEMIINIINKQEKYYKDESKNILRAVDENYKNNLNILETKILEGLASRSRDVLVDVVSTSRSYHTLSTNVVSLFEEAVNKLEPLSMTYKTVEGKKLCEKMLTSIPIKQTTLKEKDSNYQHQKRYKAKAERQALLDLKKTFKEKSKIIFDQVIDDSYEELMEIESTFVDMSSEVRKGQLEIDTDYLKNDLLCEIRNFEEMVHKSLRKIVDYEDEDIWKLVSPIERLYNELRKTLNDHGIRFVEPDPHEKFDSKVHEIILSKKMDSFSKGDIISCKNIGYAKDAHIVLKATVIIAE